MADLDPPETKKVCLEDKKILKYKLIKDPIHGSIELHPLLYWITTTPAFHRLKYIKQLSGLYYLYPGATHTRFEHSIGVCYLAGEFASMLIKKLRKCEGIQKENEVHILCIQIAGLCHDLGHGPFSHLFEPLMEFEDFKISHAELSTRILEEVIYKKNKEYFEKHGVTDRHIEDIKNMIERSKEFKDNLPTDLYLYEIIANKSTGIDVDKWDYFIRDCHYMGLQHEFDYKRLMQLSRVRSVEEEGVKRLRICYDEKEVNNILGMFRTRCSLHLKAYKHKTSIAVSYMLRTAIKEVFDLDLIYYGGKKWPMKKIVANLRGGYEDLERFLSLDDGIIHVILNTDPASLKKVETEKGEEESEKRKLETSQKWLIDLRENKIPHRIFLPKERRHDVYVKMKGMKEEDREAIPESVCKKMMLTDERKIFVERVELSYISETSQESPLEKIYVYKDGQSNDDHYLQEGDPHLLTDESQSLRLFTPLQYALEEYWWYSALETEKDAEVESAILEVFEELKSSVLTQTDSPILETT